MTRFEPSPGREFPVTAFLTAPEFDRLKAHADRMRIRPWQVVYGELLDALDRLDDEASEQ